MQAQAAEEKDLFFALHLMVLEGGGQMQIKKNDCHVAVRHHRTCALVKIRLNDTETPWHFGARPASIPSLEIIVYGKYRDILMIILR